MKIGTDSFHLTYCTNIHPGEAWQEVFTNLKHYIPALKVRLSPTEPFGIGLRLANFAAQELLEGDNLAQFQSWLSEQNLYVFTLNGFPYGGFHHQVLKEQVYAPDWSTQERLDYTLRLAKILAALLPAGIDGGISTVPLSYKSWWKENSDKKNSEFGVQSSEFEFSQNESILNSTNTAFKKSSSHLALVTAEMVRLREETGKRVHLDLEPEPDGLLENAAEVIDFFQNWLLPTGGAELAECQGISQESAEHQLLEHICVCYDTCHFAVEYEAPASAIQRLQAAGIQIGKIQLSAAIQVTLPEPPQEQNLVMERLRPFAESTYLHQVIERRKDGTFSHYPDLDQALSHLEQSAAQEWRTHFHVPIFIRDYHHLQSTQDHLITVLELLQDNHACKHLEIETYTWDVLPAEMKTDLLSSIQREYEWVLGRMKDE
jgi:hypothetical protein